jgi:hypothetical protein
LFPQLPEQQATPALPQSESDEQVVEQNWLPALSAVHA